MNGVDPEGTTVELGARGYLREMALYAKGITWGGVKGTAVGAYQMLAHPLATLEGLGNAIVNYEQTYEGLKYAWEHAEGEAQGELMFNVLTAVGPMAATKATAAAKVARLAKAADTASDIGRTVGRLEDGAGAGRLVGTALPEFGVGAARAGELSGGGAVGNVARSTGEILQELFDASDFPRRVPGKHHLMPHALGNELPYGHKSLTLLKSAMKHTVLQGALDDYLRGITKTLPNGRVVSMLPTRGNPGTIVRRMFSPVERVQAVDRFYRGFAGGRYYPAFRMELNAARKAGRLR